MQKKSIVGIMAGLTNNRRASSMQQMRTRGAMARRLMAFILVTFFAVGLAFGQTGQIMRFEIPYEFTVGSKVLPAGTYTFTFSLEESRLRVQSAKGGTSTNIITQLSGPAQFLRDGSLVFDKTEGGRILSEVWMPGTDGVLVHSVPKNHRRDVLIVPVLSETRTVSGKAAYGLTCARCHGPDGKGDEGADKFFNTTIPRLSSAEVQSKSDAELRQQITQGGRLMPPVEIDESGFRHRLPPQDVDAVIAYVRTLKR
jgi:mono/diheme cytochrome c family protein